MLALKGSEIAQDLRSTITGEYARLMAISDAAAAKRPAPGKWSPKEVIGHLVDSASNNHGRFVRAQLEKDLVFSGYDQDGWVRVQRYDTRPWSELVTLWRSLNLHIASIIESMPDEALSLQREHHNLDEIAWRTLSPDTPVTLEYFVRDYLAHLKHHLAQIP